MAKHDPVNSPTHYVSLGSKCEKCGHPIECITITEKFDFNIGNAIKYLWRAGLKNGLQDLQKSQWYVNRAVVNEKNRLEEIETAFNAEHEAALAQLQKEAAVLNRSRRGRTR